MFRRGTITPRISIGSSPLIVPIANLSMLDEICLASRVCLQTPISMPVSWPRRRSSLRVRDDKIVAVSTNLQVRVTGWPSAAQSRCTTTTRCVFGRSKLVDRVGDVHGCAAGPDLRQLILIGRPAARCLLALQKDCRCFAGVRRHPPVFGSQCGVKCGAENGRLS
jgi:hypothetical protein